jgi:hypothetical protein
MTIWLICGLVICVAAPLLFVGIRQLLRRRAARRQQLLNPQGGRVLWDIAEGGRGLDVKDGAVYLDRRRFATRIAGGALAVLGLAAARKALRSEAEMSLSKLGGGPPADTWGDSGSGSKHDATTRGSGAEHPHDQWGDSGSGSKRSATARGLGEEHPNDQWGDSGSGSKRSATARGLGEEHPNDQWGDSGKHTRTLRAQWGDSNSGSNKRSATARGLGAEHPNDTWGDSGSGSKRSATARGLGAEHPNDQWGDSGKRTRTLAQTDYVDTSKGGKRTGLAGFRAEPPHSDSSS